MKTFEIRVTQDLTGFYEGKLQINANSKTEAKKILSKLSKDKIDDMAEWSQGDDMDGDIDTIETHDELEEIEF